MYLRSVRGFLPISGVIVGVTSLLASGPAHARDRWEGCARVGLAPEPNALTVNNTTETARSIEALREYQVEVRLDGQHRLRNRCGIDGAGTLRVWLFLSEKGQPVPKDLSSALNGSLSLGAEGASRGVSFVGELGKPGNWVYSTAEFKLGDADALPARVADAINFYDAFRFIRYTPDADSEITYVDQLGKAASTTPPSVPYEMEAHVRLEWTPNPASGAEEVSNSPGGEALKEDPLLHGAVNTGSVERARERADALAREFEVASAAARSAAIHRDEALVAFVAARGEVAAAKARGEAAAIRAAEAALGQAKDAHDAATTAFDRAKSDERVIGRAAASGALVANALSARLDADETREELDEAVADVADKALAVQKAREALDAAKKRAEPSAANVQEGGSDAGAPEASSEVKAAEAALMTAQSALAQAEAKQKDAEGASVLAESKARTAEKALREDLGQPDATKVFILPGETLSVDVKDVPLVEFSVVNHPGALAIIRMQCQDLVGTNASAADDPNPGQFGSYCASNPSASVWMDSAFTTPLGLRLRIAPVPDWSAFGISAELSTVALGDSGWFSEVVESDDEPEAGVVSPAAALAGFDLQADVGGTRLTFQGGGGLMLLDTVDGDRLRPFFGFNISVPIVSVNLGKTGEENQE